MNYEIEKDILLTADLFSQLQNAEWQTLEGQANAVGATAEPLPGAGKFAYSQLYNPPGSGVFLAGVQVTQANFSPSGFHQLRRFDTSLAAASGVWGALTVALPSWVDFRTAGQPAAVLQSRVNTAAAQIGDLIARQRGTAGVTGINFNGSQFVLPPGTGLVVTSVLANSLVEAAWAWREVVITNDYGDEPIRTLLAQRRQWGLL
jgi:hypothetical protein